MPTKNIQPIRPLLSALLYAGAFGCSSSWELKETKNEMDDSVRYSVITKSDREVKFKDRDTFNPLLSVTVERGATTVRFAPNDVIDFSDFRNGRQLGSVKVRFDDEEPFQVSTAGIANSNGQAAYLEGDDLVGKMLAHKKMKVQWAMAAGGTPVDTFKLDGMKNALLKICSKAPAACERDKPIGKALASVGEPAGGGSTSPATTTSSSSCPSGQELREERFPGTQVVKSRGCVSKAGKEEGVLTQWYPSGNKASEFTYVGGVRNGPATMWHDNGQKSAVGTFKDGQLEGQFNAWHPNGQQAEQVTLKAGKKNGLAIRWDTSGKKTEEYFNDDKLVAADAAPGISLPSGTFTATTTEWKAARDAVLTWCGANSGKCTGDAMELLKAPADGALTVSGDDGTLTTCSPGNCPTVTVVSFKRAGANWSITKVEAAPMGD